jgi:hypothetical protein
VVGEHGSQIRISLQMAKFPDDPASRFLEYYGRYLTAKSQKESEMIWLNAVACRVELRKMGDPTEEAEHCQNIFKEFVSQKQAQQIYRDLCDDSRSYPQQ